MEFIYGVITNTRLVKTKAGREAIVYTVASEQWNRETKAMEPREVPVWYFSPERGSVIAYEKAKTTDYSGKTVLFAVTDLGADGVSKATKSAPRTYGICDIPATIKSGITDEEIMDIDEKIAACIAAEELPEGFVINPEDINSVVGAQTLAAKFKTETAKALVTALYRIYNEAEYAYIGTAASVKKNEKENGVVSFSLPVKPGDETKWASAVYYGKSADTLVKAIRTKEKCILFLVARNEVEGRTLFTGRRVVRLK